MRHGLSQTQERALVRPEGNGTAPAAPALKEIPYDYVARFELEGRRGNRVQDVINISVDGAFVAVAIGYSFIPARPPEFTNRPDPVEIRRRLALLQQLASTPLNGLAGIALNVTNSTTTLREALALLQPLVDPLALVACFLARNCGIDFKYTIIDSGTGRELQNRPIHNLAGLGEATGERPFRPLAKPILFQPRSTIRIEVEEISHDFPYGYDDNTGRRVGSELYIVLHGYKILGYQP